MASMARMNQKKPNLCFYNKKRERRMTSASVAGSATGLDLSALFIHFLFLASETYSLFKRANGDGDEAK